MSDNCQKKVALLFSHNTHSFIISEVRYAASVFNQVVVLCPDDDEIRNESQKHDNVVYHPILNVKSLRALMGGKRHLSGLLKKELGDVRRNSKFSVHYFKVLGLYAVYTALLFDEMQGLLKKYSADEIVVVSLWFSSTSFAASIMKEKYPGITAVSLAHSFEVDDEKNEYVDYFFKDFCHEKLDHIFFISEIVKDMYISKHAAPHSWNTENISVTYLGVTKKREGISNPTSGHPHRLVSCSHCLPVKRIGLIADSLKLIDDLEIEWVHIGGGPTLKEIEADDSLTGKIKVVTLGKRTNDFVHDYLCSTEIDAFINVSSSEGLPVTLMEAIAYGIPIIATDVGGTSEIFRGEIGKLLVANPTPKEVSDSIKNLLSNDSCEQLTLRENAYRCYCKCFDAGILRRKFYDMLSKSRFEGTHYVCSD